MYDFVKVGEGIYREVNTLKDEDMDYLYNLAVKKINSPVENEKAVPWEQGNQSNVLYYPAVEHPSLRGIEDRRAFDIINKYNTELEKTLKRIHGEDIYAHLTTIVLWKPGQQMSRHVDNGSGFEGDQAKGLSVRKYTSVTYLNDNFSGGETFIRSDGKTEPSYRSKPEYGMPNNDFTDYISKPVKGATVLFSADEKNAHGVNKLLDGTRVILTSWFTTDPASKQILL